MNEECLNVLRAVCNVTGVTQNMIKNTKRFGCIAMWRALYFDVATTEQGLDPTDTAMVVDRQPRWATAAKDKAVPMYKDSEEYIEMRSKVLKELERMKIQQSEDETRILAETIEKELEERRKRYDEIRQTYYRPVKCLLYDFEYTAQENWDIYNACLEAGDKMRKMR